MKGFDGRARWRVTLALAVLACVVLAGVGWASAGVLPVVVGGTRPESPAVSGGRVVWSDKVSESGGYRVYSFDRSSRYPVRLSPTESDQIQPAISGDVVVWVDYRAGEGDIFAKNLATGVETQLTNSGGDHLNPSVSGQWVAWENAGSGYSSTITAYDMSTGRQIAIAGSYNAPAKRPRVAGNFVVWEDYALQGQGRTDGDVKLYDLTTGLVRPIATTTNREILPDTDGRYVVWAESNGADLDIRSYDTQTAQYAWVRQAPAEQTAPTVAAGVVYWADSSPDRATRIESFDLNGAGYRGAVGYSRGDSVAPAADGTNVVWLERANSRWRIVGMFDTFANTVRGFAGSIVPAGKGLALYELARSASAPDMTHPQVSAFSVKPGQKAIRRTSTFKVSFSKRLAPRSVTAKSVKLVNTRTGRTVRARVRYSALTKSVSINPARALTRGSYSIIVAPTVTDLAGNPVGQQATVTFATIGVAAAADVTPPSVPDKVVARVDTLANVTVTWTASLDDVGVTGYDLYRSAAQITPTNVDSLTRVGWTAGGTSLTVAKDSGEVTTKYEYYYAVRAYDAAGNKSIVSANACPDPHGVPSSSYTNSCMRCHTVHGGAANRGALGALTAQACYGCHGGTAQGTLYGSASTLNAQSDFRDYAQVASTGPVRGTGSIHRNTYMVSIQRECDSCHGPHKQPYNADPTLSYNKLVRTQSATSPVNAYTYNKMSAPVGNNMCWNCHGTAGTGMTIAGGATAWSNQAGDHQAGYGTSAHGAKVAANAGDTNPNIQCEACHNKHQSSIAQLIDYRESGVTDSQNDQSGLCFKCHSATGVESGKPNTWNGRDVKAEFARVSHHPYTASVSAPLPQANTFLQTTPADFASDVLNNTLSLAGGIGTSGALQLAPSGANLFAAGTAISPSITNASGTLNSWNSLVLNGALATSTSMTFDVLNAADDSVIPGYAAKPFSGTSTTVDLSGINAATYPALHIRANLQGNASTPRSSVDTFGNAMIDPMWTDSRIGLAPDPDAAQAISLPVITFASTLLDPTTGMDSLSPANPAPGNVWTQSNNNGSDGVTPGRAQTNPTTHSTPNSMDKNLGDLSSNTSVDVNYWYRPSSTLGTNDNMIVYWSTDGGASWTTLRTHSRAANNSTTWTPYTNPGLSTGTSCILRFSSTVVSTGWNIPSNQVDTIAITENKPATNIWPAEGGGVITLKAAGADFWTGTDQGEFLNTTQAWYATNDFDMKVHVASITDTDPAASNGWLKAGLMARNGADAVGALVNSAAYAGVFVTTSKGVQFQYRTPGGNTMTLSSNVAAPTAPEWVRLTKTGTSYAAYYSPDGSTWNQVGTAQTVATGATVLVGPALTSHIAGTFSLATFDNFSITEGGITATLSPRLDDLTVNYNYTPAATGNSLACVNCHNSHKVSTGAAATWWQLVRMSDPSNTKNTPADSTSFCLGCHDGTPPTTALNGQSVLVPYNVQLSNRPESFFPGWNKTASGFEFTSSGHYTTAGTKALCANCHDPHGSSYARLTAWTKPASGITGGNAGTRDNTTVGSAFEENLCFQCHGDGTTSGKGKGTTAQNVYGDMYGTGDTATHPVTANGTTAKHSDLEGPAALIGANRHVECVDCHDPHAERVGNHTQGSSVAGGSLRGSWGVVPTYGATNWSAPTGYSVKRLAGGATDYEALNCLRCHSSYLPNWSTAAPNSPSSVAAARTYRETDMALEFNPNNVSGHNVLGSSFSKVFAKNGWTWAAGTTSSMGLGAGWTATSGMTCSDCHASVAGAKGPHGSTNRFGLKFGATTANWYSVRLYSWGNATTNFCAGCHTTNPHGSSWMNDDSAHDIACEGCHVRIPHGWKRPRLLAYHGQAATDNLPYVDPNVSGITGATGSMTTSNSMNKDQCYTNCGEHNNANGTLW